MIKNCAISLIILNILIGFPSFVNAASVQTEPAVLRVFPYPYGNAMPFASDADGSYAWHHVGIHRFFNEELGLTIADSLWPHGNTSMALFKGGGAINRSPSGVGTHTSFGTLLREWHRGNMEMYMEKGKIEIEALTYIRGRSISNAFIVIDEAQNLTKHEIKTIITRIGEGTKIILTGDVEQIDNVYVNETSNGLAHAVEKFKEHHISGHMTFKKGERSELATLASKVL